MNQNTNSLPNSFAVFILTHGRPNNVITLKTLEKCGYTGRLYLVCDNEDKTIDCYRQNFGADRVIVFDKKAEADACDEGNNFDDRRGAIFARNACFKIAGRLGIRHFLMLEDDYYYFGLRFEEGAKKTTKIDRVIMSLLSFLISSGSDTIAMAQGGDHIGGFCGLKMKRKAMNSFLCSTEKPFEFRGILNDDVNTYVTLGVQGRLFFTFTGIQLDQKDTQGASGGMSDFYLKFGTYCKSFTTVMMQPSSVRVSMMQSNNPRIHHSINWATTVPQIISQKYKKEAL